MSICFVLRCNTLLEAVPRLRFTVSRRRLFLDDDVKCGFDEVLQKRKRRKKVDESDKLFC